MTETIVWHSDLGHAMFAAAMSNADFAVMIIGNDGNEMDLRVLKGIRIPKGVEGVNGKEMTDILDCMDPTSATSGRFCKKSESTAPKSDPS